MSFDALTAKATMAKAIAEFMIWMRQHGYNVVSLGGDNTPLNTHDANIREIILKFGGIDGQDVDMQHEAVLRAVASTSGPQPVASNEARSAAEVLLVLSGLR